MRSPDSPVLSSHIVLRMIPIFATAILSACSENPVRKNEGDVFIGKAHLNTERKKLAQDSMVE